MDEIGLHFNKTLAQGKVKGQKSEKERATLALVVNSTRIDKLKFLVIDTFKQPQCSGRWQPHACVWWHSNRTT